MRGLNQAAGRRRTLMSSVVRGTAIGIAALTLAACTQAATPTPSTSAGAELEMDHITIGLSVPAMTYGPIYLADQEGLFAAEGLTARVVTFQGGSDLVRAVTAGAVDIGVTALPEVASTAERGQGLKVFYGGYNHTFFSWYAKDPAIQSIEDTAGATFGVSRAGSSTDFLTRYLINTAGMDPRSDVTIRGVGNTAAILAALETDQIDVAILSPNFGLEAERNGMHLIAKQSELAAQYPYHVAFADESFLADNPNTVEAFLRAQVAGMNMQAEQPELLEEILVSEIGVQPDIAPLVIPLAIEATFPDGSLPDAASMEVFWNIGILNEQWTAPIPESVWLDRTWIDSYPEWLN